MVLQASDYQVSNLWRSQWNPKHPKSFLTKAAGTVVAATFAIFLLAVAVRKGVPFLNELVSRFTGGHVSTGGAVQVF